MHNARGLRHYLRRGGVIAYATESCFGLGCDPRNRLGVQRILRLKGRPQHKGLILIATHLQQLQLYIGKLNADQQTQMLLQRSRPHTWLAPIGDACPKWLSGKHRSIAVRITDFPPTRNLCKNADIALVSTSANRSGQRPAKTYAQCQRLFGHKVWVLPGRVGKRKQPSTISRWADGKIIRS